MALNIIITVDRYKPSLRYFEYFLARELAISGHNVTVLTFGPRLRGGSTEREEGFRVVYLPYLFTLTSWFWIPAPGALASVARVIRDAKPDVMHCMPLYSPLSLVSAALAGPGVVRVGSVFSGDLFMKHAYDKVRFNLIRAIVKGWVAGRADAFFALSGYLKARLTEWFAIPEDEIRVVPLGTDPDQFMPDRSLRARARSDLGFSRRDVVLVYSGKFIPDKGIELLLAAERDLAKSHPEAKVLLVGTGPAAYVEGLRGLCRELGIADKVTFHPFVARDELAALYNASDIAVWPGTHSISMVDAVSVGLPLVMTPKFPAWTSLIRNGNGLAFRAGELDDLVAALEPLVACERLRLEMGKKSRALARRELDWASIGKTYLDAYKGLVGRRLRLPPPSTQAVPLEC